MINKWVCEIILYDKLFQIMSQNGYTRTYLSVHWWALWWISASYILTVLLLHLSTVGAWPAPALAQWCRVGHHTALPAGVTMWPTLTPWPCDFRSEEPSPQWLKELKSKKRQSLYENQAWQVERAPRSWEQSSGGAEVWSWGVVPWDSRLCQGSGWQSDWGSGGLVLWGWSWTGQPGVGKKGLAGGQMPRTLSCALGQPFLLQLRPLL